MSEKEEEEEVEKENYTHIKTKLGCVYENNNGYYRLSNNKLLHRTIWENFYGQKVPDGYVIHHKDHNPHNNSISNLQLMTELEHTRHHHKGKTIDENTKKRMSKLYNTTGYFRVNIKPCTNCKQGFVYRYQWIDELGKKQALTSTKLSELMLKVQGKGLPWKRISEL